MKKAVSLFCLALMFALALGSCNSPKPPSQETLELGKKLVGKWKFLYTDAAEQIPPADMTYTFMENQTSRLDYTDEKNEKQSVSGVYKINGDQLQFFKEEKLAKEFEIQFPDENTLRLTEPKSKNSMVLQRVRE